MQKRAQSRRAFLSTLGVAAALMPFVPRLQREALAAGSARPKRLIIVFTPNGTVPSKFYPTGSEHTFELNTITEPLAPHKQDLVILQGLNNVAAADSPVDGHWAISTMLTGAPLRQDDTFSVTYNEGTPSEVTKYFGWGSAPSVDQLVAAEIGKDTLLSSIELGVRVDYDGTPGRPNYRMCYAGSNKPIAPDDDPLSVFDRIFGSYTSDPGEANRIRARRMSVMDHLSGELGVLKTKLGSAETHKLDAHLDAIRELELRLEKSLVSCEPIAPDFSGSKGSAANFPLVGSLQMDLMVQALACDATRVASLQWASENGSPRAAWLDHPEGNYLHKLSHAAASDPMHQQFIEYQRWYAEQVASLVQRLKDVEQADGSTLFDDTLVLWTHAIGHASNHDTNDVPAVLFGNAGGAFETGRYLELGERPINRLLVSICQAMGVQRDWVGDEKYGTGGLAEL